MNLSKIEKIQELIKRSACSLGSAVQHYWPVINYEKNGLQESNLTIHFAAHAMGLGLHAYPEASNGNNIKGHSRVDLLVKGVLNEENISILVESKKLFSAEKAQEICNDFEKIKAFEFVRIMSGEADNENTSAYGVLLAITSREVNAAWWNEPYPYDNGSWDSLGEILKIANVKGFFEIPCHQSQYILYAIYKLD